MIKKIKRIIKWFSDAINYSNKAYIDALIQQNKSKLDKFEKDN